MKIKRRHVAGLVVTAAGMFCAVAYATAAQPGANLPSSLPAAALPIASIGHDAAIALNNLIPVAAAEKYGITEDSYNHVRILQNTEVGPLYVIPGANGVCLALTNTSGCSDYGAGGPVLVALALPGTSGAYDVGGGLTTGAVRSVGARRGDGALGTTKLVTGGFVLDANTDMPTGDALTLEVK
jgi:hypothetical protein